MASSPTTDDALNSGQGEDLTGRRRARTIVNEALLSVGTPLQARGVHHRLLPGLWQAAMNVVLSCFEAEDVLALLADRARGIVGEGSNADAPARVIQPQRMPAYIREVNLSAQTIMEGIEVALDRLRDENLDDRFPETVLDAALHVLIPAWGPHHVRRALSEQAALVICGTLAPCNFMEPVTLQAPPSASDRKVPDQDGSPPERDPSSDPDSPAIEARRNRPTRKVSAFCAIDIAPSGTAAWAVAISAHDEDGRMETREISGTMQDPSGRAVSVKALHECVLAACGDSSGANVVIETPSEQCVRAAVGGGSPGSRLPGEESLWEDIDRAAAAHRIEFRVARFALDRELSERCDRILRKRLGG